MSETETFASFGNGYQERVIQVLLQDHQYADQMSDCLLPEFFDLAYLQEIAKQVFDHKRKFKTFPSLEILGVMIDQDAQKGLVDDTVRTQALEYLVRIKKVPLNGDMGYIQESSLEFCRKQSLKDGMNKAIDMLKSGKYDSIVRVINEALAKGGSRDLGHEYSEGTAVRGQKNVRNPVSTGWKPLDAVLGGGWERKTLTTFIGGTGAGKSMFLVNCGAAALQQGLNVCYFTLEMADWKIGLRFDSYYTGVDINNVGGETAKVQEAISQQVKGRLFIKEFPTKQATVQTLRAHLQRLQATKQFVPDMVILDYADLLRGTRGSELRHELGGIYEDLRGLAQEFNVILITADQTNRSGMDDELVTVQSIGESYTKATICDLILTISRTKEDKMMNLGRLYNAKSRLGPDGQVFPFKLTTATVKVQLFEQSKDTVDTLMENDADVQSLIVRRAQSYKK